MIFSVQIKQLLRIKALFAVEIPQVLSNGDNCTANPGQWRHSKLVYFTRSWMRFRFISLVDGVNMGQEDGCVTHSGGFGPARAADICRVRRERVLGRRGTG